MKTSGRYARILVLAGGLGTLGACQSGDSPSSTVQTTPSAEEAALTGPVFVQFPSGGRAVAPFVRRQLDETSPGRGLLVYVGARWCEPCTRFHDAVESGALDETFPGLRLIEFDLDRDRDALEEAGYASKLIPLFAVPGPDGRGGDRRISGSIKGERAVPDNLVPRLRRLLAQDAVL